MSLLTAIQGIKAATGGGGLLGLGLFKGLGKINSTRQQDWDRAVAQGSVAKYFPKGCPPDVVCGPGFMMGPGGMAGGFAPMALPGGSTAIAPYTPQFPALLPPAQQVSFSQAATPIPVMGMLPKIGGMMGGWTTGGLMKGLRASLPVLDRAIAYASGYMLIRGIWYDRSGSAVGRARRRRRVNPLNYRAAMRAARRLQAVQKLTGRINSALPTARKNVKKFRFKKKGK